MDVLASLSKRIMGRITCEPRGPGNFQAQAGAPGTGYKEFSKLKKFLKCS